MYMAGLAAYSWPLRNYRLVLRVTFAGAVGFLAVGLLNALLTLPSHTSKVMLLGVGLTMLASFWVGTGSLLCGVVWLRRRYWPVYGPGQCIQCGYDLRGLANPRCPECATPFEAAEPTSDECGADDEGDKRRIPRILSPHPNTGIAPSQPRASCARTNISPWQDHRAFLAWFLSLRLDVLNDDDRAGGSDPQEDRLNEVKECRRVSTAAQLEHDCTAAQQGGHAREA